MTATSWTIPISKNRRAICFACDCAFYRSAFRCWLFNALDFFTIFQNDYIEIGKLYHAILISNVPQMNVKNDDLARRFINLIDEFYDRGVKVIMSADAAIPDIYTTGSLEFPFQRTTSRMLEMQSHDYLAREHKAD